MGVRMKTSFMLMAVLAVFLSAGCATQNAAKAGKDNLRKYLADLNGNGIKLAVETRDDLAVDSQSVVTVKNNDKVGEVLDTILVSGKIKNLEFAELNLDGQEWLVIHSEGKDARSNISIYQFKHNDLIKIFSAFSAYGIEASFDSVAKVKIGKSLQGNNSPNLVPYWDTWVWSGDKFILD